MTSHLKEESMQELADALVGEVVTPDHPDYDTARRVWNVMHDRRPLAIARVASTEDVVAVINFAVRRNLPIAARGGGHSVVGFGTCDDGIVVDLRKLNEVEVDTATGRVRAGGGTIWGEFDAATQEHGLAVTGGRVSTTGIGGLTLGSGSGWLERKMGFTHDNLVSIELVTARGEVVTASRDERPELFWGMRGGGGNFGIVTKFEFQAQPIGPTVVGGMMLATKDKARTVMQYMRALMVDASEDLGTAVFFTGFPDLDFVPEEYRNQPTVAVMVCWSGPQEEGERLLAEIRDVVQPAVDLTGLVPYTQLQSMNNAPDAWTPLTRAYMKAEYISDLTDESIDVLVKYFERLPSPTTNLMLEPLGGAVDRVPDGDSALIRPKGRWCYHAMALWLDDAQESEDVHRAWARDLAAEMEPFTTSGIFLTYSSDAVENERVRKSFGEDRYARLVTLKDEYDPTNVFRINQNIVPSAADGTPLAPEAALV